MGKRKREGNFERAMPVIEVNGPGSLEKYVRYFHAYITLFYIR